MKDNNTADKNREKTKLKTDSINLQHQEEDNYLVNVIDTPGIFHFPEHSYLQQPEETDGK